MKTPPLAAQPASTSQDLINAQFEEDMRSSRPFFWIVIVVMVGLTILALYLSPALRSPVRLVAFLALMLLNIGLHWVSPRLLTRPLRWTVFYLLFQGALAMALILLAWEISLALGLYMSLVGESFGMVEDRRKAGGFVLLYLFLAGMSLVMLQGWQSLWFWVVPVIPMTIFVIIYVEMYRRQADARSRAQILLGELEMAHQQLTEYAGQVEDMTLAAERQRMARELHDTLAQGVAGLILQLEAADSHLGSGRAEKAQTIIRQAMTRARSTLADSRRVIDDLRQGGGQGDLVGDAQEEVNRFITATGIPCELELSLEQGLAPAACEQALRMLSEALTNVARHGQASRVWVRLGSADGWIEVSVRDDGLGFDPAQPPGPGHYGLLGLRERARLAGGELEVSSQPGSGTSVRLRLPVAVCEPGEPAAGNEAADG